MLRQPDVGQGVDDALPGHRALLVGERRHHHPLVHQVQRRGEIQRRDGLGCRAAFALGADETRRSGRSTCCMKRCPRTCAVSALVASASVAGARHDADTAAKASKNVVMPLGRRAAGRLGSVLHRAVEAAVRLANQRVEQRQQHRVLGREVEVERRAATGRRPWPGRRRRCRRTSSARAGARRCARIAASRSSPDGRVARRPRAARAGLAVLTA